MTKQTMWRTLVRVVDCRRPDGLIVVCIPARGARYENDLVMVPESWLPNDILDTLVVGKRLHVRANWDAEFEQDIEFEGWEYD